MHRCASHVSLLGYISAPCCTPLYCAGTLLRTHFLSSSIVSAIASKASSYCSTLSFSSSLFRRLPILMSSRSNKGESVYFGMVVSQLLQTSASSVLLVHCIHAVSTPCLHRIYAVSTPYPHYVSSVSTLYLHLLAGALRYHPMFPKADRHFINT